MPRMASAGKLDRTPPLDANGRFTLGCFLGMTVADAEEIEEDYLADVRRFGAEIASEKTYYLLSEGKTLHELFLMWAWAVTKDYGLLKLVPTFAQEDTLQEIMAAGREERACVLYVLKARQLGQTTGIQCIWYLLAAQMAHRRFLTMAHKDEKTLGIARMQFDMHQAMPFRPRVRFALSRRRVQWVETQSELGVESAEGRDPGRSSAFNFLHMSEHPLFDRAEEVDTAYASTKPNYGFYVWIREGTGNGVGNAFYRGFKDAEAGRGIAKAKFHPWWRHPAYESPVAPEDRHRFTQSELEEHERDNVDYVQGQGINLLERIEKLNWYRRELVTFYKGDIDKMWQENPTWPMQAFLSGGRPVFDLKGFERLLAMQRLDPVFTGDILA